MGQYKWMLLFGNNSDLKLKAAHWGCEQLSPLLQQQLNPTRLAVDSKLQDQAMLTALESNTNPPANFDLCISMWFDEPDGTQATTKRVNAIHDILAALHHPFQRTHCFVVECFNPKAYIFDWSLGQPSPGLKMISLMRPIAGKSPEACIRHWRQHHTPLALKIHIGLWNYQQNVVVKDLFNPTNDIYGIAELHFRSLEDFQEKYFDSPEGVQTIMEDTTHFLDLEATETFNTTETLISNETRS